MEMKYKIIITALSAILFFAPPSFCDEEVHYKKFNLDDKATCYVGVLYQDAPEGINKGMNIGVSAIAIGKGAEFRKWNIPDIRLSIAGEKIRPAQLDKFYVTKESFFRVPAAILFAAIGTQLNMSGSSFEQGLGKAGAAVGLGLLVLQAHGEIAGEKCAFSLNKETVDKISKTDAVEITVEHEGMHLKYRIKVGIIKGPSDIKQWFDYKNMSQDGLRQLMDTLEAQVATLEKNQAGYKYGSDPEYDELQRKIERLETERGIAYKLWFEREQENRK